MDNCYNLNRVDVDLLLPAAPASSWHVREGDGTRLHRSEMHSKVCSASSKVGSTTTACIDKISPVVPIK